MFGGLVLNQGLVLLDSGCGLSIGWNYLLVNGVIFGLVVSLCSDVIVLMVRSVGEVGYVNMFGWCMDYQVLWGVYFWVQVSYNQLFVSDVWVLMFCVREGGWSDVILGVDMWLGFYVVVWVMLLQVDNLLLGENMFYLMGVSVNF